MDRYCEYCVNLRSVVYCKADAAYLCLSCDTKVHSANPLSNRHHRTLICDTCKRRPAYNLCYDHQKFMCRGCDLSQHKASFKHRKRVLNSYVGCPSARDLGVLWDFDLNQVVNGNVVLDYKLGSTPSASKNTSVVGLETNVHIKEFYRRLQGFPVLQQLVDLLKVESYDADHTGCVTRCQEHIVETDVDQFSRQLLFGGGPLDDPNMNLDPCSSPFTELDHIKSETDEIDLQGDSFWQCKSPIPSDQLWSQNMQDIGVCEEPVSLDDLNMPDIDLTFRNFEDLFRIEQEPSTAGQNTSMDTFVNNSESSPKKARYASQIMSFSHSRLSPESSSTVCIESGVSPSCGSLEQESSNEDKNVQLKDSKQGKCGYRKARSDTQRQTKSQNWKFRKHLNFYV